MSVFIELNAVRRNGQPFTKKILVDVNKIVTPIIENEMDHSIIEVDTDVSYSESYFGNFEKYEVSETLDDINLLTSELFKGTIITQNDRAALWPEALFIKSKIVGVVRDNGGESSEFDYERMAQASTDRFVVNESFAVINS